MIGFQCNIVNLLSSFVLIVEVYTFDPYVYPLLATNNLPPRLLPFSRIL